MKQPFWHCCSLHDLLLHLWKCFFLRHHIRCGLLRCLFIIVLAVDIRVDILHTELQTDFVVLIVVLFVIGLLLFSGSFRRHQQWLTPLVWHFKLRGSDFSWNLDAIASAERNRPTTTAHICLHVCDWIVGYGARPKQLDILSATASLRSLCTELCYRHC